MDGGPSSSPEQLRHLDFVGILKNCQKMPIGSTHCWKRNMSRVTGFKSTTCPLALVPLALFTVASLFSLSSTAQDIEDSDDQSFLNAYEQGRSELLTSQGLELMDNDQFEAAERIFLDAMQIAKINYGLDSPEQRIPLEHAIAAQLAQGKWEQVDKHFSYFEWLNDEVYAQDFYDYLRGTEKLSDMLLKASADTSNPFAVRYLIAAKNLNWRAVSAIEATLGDKDVRLAPWLYNIVLSHYYQSSLVKRHGMASNIYRNDNDEEIVGWTLTMGDSMRISYRIGRDLLDRIVALYNEAESPVPESAALAQMYRADWDMLFGNETDALVRYKNAFDGLLSAGFTAEQANALFAEPTVLPDSTLHATVNSLTAAQIEGPVRFNAWTPNYPATAAPSERVTLNGGTGTEIMALVRFDLLPLLPSGLLNNDRTIQFGFNFDDLEVVQTTPDNPLIRARARYEVSLLQFRPKLENGAPVRLENVELEYLFPPQYSSIRLSGN